MKKLYTILVALFITATTFAQAPEKMSYQAVIRDSGGALVTNQAVGMQISILQTTATGTAVYVETQTPTTNTNGLVTLDIGTGAVITGSFNSIEWDNGPYFIKTETDPTGGSNYTISGTSQLMSVPYALYAASSATPNKTTAERDAIESPAIGLTIYNTTTNCLNFYTPSGWNETCGTFEQTYYPAGSVFCAAVAAIVDVTNPSTGKIWMDRNLGATQAATSLTDAASYGDLYQWGRRSDGHQCRTSPTTGTLSSSDQPANGNFILAPSTPYDWRSPQNTNLWQGVNGVNNPCPSGYRLPTETEIYAEQFTWNTNNSTGAFASPLKWPMAGYRLSSNGLLYNVGTNGIYWSSTVSGINSRNLFFFSSYALVDTSNRANGFSVRCLKD